MAIKPGGMTSIAAISGCAQQHGVMFWNHLVPLDTLSCWSSSSSSCSSETPSLLTVFSGGNNKVGSGEGDSCCFESLRNAPIWMCSSGSTMTRALTARFGGEEEFARRTGSNLSERFSAILIGQALRKHSIDLERIQAITLISNGMNSVLAEGGSIASLDLRDARGTGLVNVQSADWDPEICNAVHPLLHSKLAPIMRRPDEAVSNAKRIAPYFVRRFGFSSDCQVFAFTGDNPSSHLAMQLGRDEICMSLGTSDTLTFAQSSQRASTSFHESIQQFTFPVFDAAVNCGGGDDNDVTASMLVYRNGSLTRNLCLEVLFGGDVTWPEIDAELLEQHNQDRCAEKEWSLLAAFYAQTEIVPNGHRGIFVYDRAARNLLFASNALDEAERGEGEHTQAQKETQRCGMDASDWQDEARCALENCFQAIRQNIRHKAGKHLDDEKADKENRLLDGFCLRLLIEYQLLAKKYHVQRILSASTPDEQSRANVSSKLPFSRILITGGASQSPLICQMTADIFDLPVYGIENSSSAAIGAAVFAWLSHCRAQQTDAQSANLSSTLLPRILLAQPINAHVRDHQT